jgi:hypothetical protein
MSLRWNWGVAVVVLYATFALSTVGFVAFAMSRPVSLVSNDYYADSLQEDRKRSATANVEALGSHFSAAMVESGDFAIHFPASHIASVNGTVTLYRAADPSLDRIVRLSPAADGSQTVVLRGLPSGAWVLQLRWSADGREFYAERDVVVR